VLTVEKVKELVKSDHFKYVVVLTRKDLYFGFSLSERLNIDVFFKLSSLVEIPVIILLVGLFQKTCLSGWAIILTG
jgi:hypothetical protein